MNESNNKRKLYVGNLPFKTSEEDLRNLFAPYGTIVSARIVVDRSNNDASKGFGFVEMETAEEAQQAAEALNGSSYEGRILIVNEARPEQKTNSTRRDDRASSRSFCNDRSFRTRRDRN
ncbi:MAG: RNA-binding protein [Chlamydiales bacterium]|jgi:RNA recognition motif-containing protein|nr:RNA-binding protein [Chlamydiales bacterium]